MGDMTLRQGQTLVKNLLLLLVRFWINAVSICRLPNENFTTVIKVGIVEHFPMEQKLKWKMKLIESNWLDTSLDEFPYFINI